MSDKPLRPGMPPPSLEDSELHPGDFCALQETNPYLVGNKPEIQHAALHGTLARVIKKEWRLLNEKERDALGVDSAYEVTVRFNGQMQYFVFWEQFLKKVFKEAPRRKP